MRQASSASSARRTRGIMARSDASNIFGAFDVPPQPEGIVGDAAGYDARDTAQLHRLITRSQHAEGIDGASHRTHASLLCPPRCIETTEPSASATRTSPPGIAIQPLPVLSTYVRSTTLRDIERTVVPHRRSGQGELVPARRIHAGGRASGRQTCPSRRWLVRLQTLVPFHARGTPVSPPPSQDDRAPNRGRTFAHTTRSRPMGSLSFSPSN
jgi:hypothetical protein